MIKWEFGRLTIYLWPRDWTLGWSRGRWCWVCDIGPLSFWWEP